MVIEVMIAVSIITVSILAAMIVAQKSVYVSRQAFHTTQAGFLLEEGAESVRIARDNAWSNISNLIVGTNYYPKFSLGAWVLNSTTIADGIVGIFTRKINISNVYRDNTTKDIVSSGGTLDIETKLVTVTVSWLEGGVTVTKILQFYVTDFFS